MALRPGVWLLVRALTLLSAPHPDRPIEKRRARDSADTAALMKLFRRPRRRVAAADYQVPVDGDEILVRCYVPEGTGPFPGHLYLTAAPSGRRFFPSARRYLDDLAADLRAAHAAGAPSHEATGR